ncbi:MAG: hypothetical protein ABIY46_10535, partial [Gemmatimonadales bacterium]
MRRTTLSTPAFFLALAAGLMAGGEGAAEQPRVSRSGGSLGTASCPTPAAIETRIRFPVKSIHLLSDRCMYELTGQYRGAFVTLTYQPATRANDLDAEIRQRVKMKGMNAKPNAVSLGEGGWGNGSRGKKAPADKAAASFDACMLATNAEVSEIAEEKPDLAKYWPAPRTSLGGAHCDYGGGAIRVYQGKTPAAALEGVLKGTNADKQPRVPVAGLGDKAFFMIPMPDNKYNRFGLLAVYAGPRVLRLTLDAHGDEPIEATRPRLERLARLV